MIYSMTSLEWWLVLTTNYPSIGIISVYCSELLQFVQIYINNPFWTMGKLKLENPQFFDGNNQPGVC
jgi:hypothetical protein